MIAVATHHVGHIAVNPFLEEIERAIVGRCAVVPSFHPFLFRELPFVASLIHHEQSFLVANVIEHRSLRIVAHANGIGTHLLQFLHFPHPYFARNDSTEYSCVMVQTHTLHLHPFSIERKTLVGIKLKCAQTHSNRSGIDGCGLSVFEKRHLQAVKIWSLQAPQLCIADSQFQRALRLPFCQLSQVGF